MLGEYLFRMTLKDARSAPVLQRAAITGGGNQAAVNVDVILGPVPLDKILYVTQLDAIGIAGAAQTLSRLGWVILTEGATAFANVANGVPNPAIQTWGFSQTTDFILMPGEQLRCRGVFSAGAAANIVSAGLIGIFLPKGTMQLR